MQLFFVRNMDQKYEALGLLFEKRYLLLFVFVCSTELNEGSHICYTPEIYLLQDTLLQMFWENRVSISLEFLSLFFCFFEFKVQGSDKFEEVFFIFFESSNFACIMRVASYSMWFLPQPVMDGFVTDFIFSWCLFYTQTIIFNTWKDLFTYLLRNTTFIFSHSLYSLHNIIWE